MSSIPSNRRQNYSRRSKYTNVACFECQRRKSKCSGENECALCRKRRVRCVYPAQGRRHCRAERGPSAVIGETTQTTVSSNDSSSTPSGQAAELDQSNHEGEGNEFQPTETEFTPFECSNETLTTPLASNFQSTTQSADRLQQLELAIKLIADISSQSLADPASSWDPEARPSASNHTSTNAPNPFILEVAERMPDNVSLPSLLAATRRLLGADPRTDHMYLSRPGRQLSPTLIQLPRMTDMRCLIDVCSKRLSMYLPKVEYDEIESKAIQPVASNNNGVSNVLTDSKDFLLFSQLYITMTVGHCLLSQASGQDVSQARSLYHQGLSLVNQVPPIPVHWLGLAKLHFLRAIYLMQADDLQAAVQAISSSIQFAWQCKLNDQTAWISCGPEETRSRKSLWWAIYCMERRLSQKVGKPYSINDKDVAVDDPLSKEQLTLCQDLEVLPDGISQDELYLQLLVDISRLWGKIWDKFFRAGCKASNDDEEVEMMGLRISHLHRSVPHVFRWSNSFLDNEDRNSEPDLETSRRLVIHTRYTLLRLLVRQSPLRTEQVGLNQARFCHVLVSELVDILTAFIAHYALPRINSLAYFMTSTLIECSYHLARILRNPLCEAERPAATRTFGKLVEMLKLLAPTVRAARRALSIFQHQISAVEDPYTRDAPSNDSSSFLRLHGYENDFISMTEYWPGLSPSTSELAQYFAGYDPSSEGLDGVSTGAERTLNSADFGQPIPTDSMTNGSLDVEDHLFPHFYLPYIG